MKLYKIADGSGYINPQLVTKCYYRACENRYLTVFMFQGGDCVEIISTTEKAAKAYLDHFVDFCVVECK